MVVASAVASPPHIWLVSHNEDGDSANDDTFLRSIAGCGRAVAFSTDATNLTEDDRNNAGDVFASNWPFFECQIESLDWNGEPATAESFHPHALSVEGRYVVFGSDADDLVLDDTNEQTDVFLRDRRTGRTTRVNVKADGTQLLTTRGYNPQMTSDARFVSFQSGDEILDDDRNRKRDVFVKEVISGDVYLASVASDGTQGNNASGNSPSPMSFDGRYIAFESDATNLVANDKNKVTDVFVHDRQTGETVRASVDSGGGEGWHISSNSSLGGISADGRYVAFDTIAEMTQGDGNQSTDVFLRDLVENTTVMVSVGKSGQGPGAGQSAISADGRYVAMSSAAKKWDDRNKDGVVQIFVRDLQKKTMTLVSENDDGEVANDECGSPQISANGRFVAFRSWATNLVEGDTHGVAQVYVRDFLGCDPFLRGDSNCDGAVDFADIDPFVLALIDEGEYVLAHLSCDWQCNNDINGDETVDFNDIDGFVECLINNGCP